MEMMVVLAIICILALFAIPIPTDNVSRKQIAESLDLIENYKKPIADLYALNQKFPSNNDEAGMPAPPLLLGNFVNRIEVENGSFHLYFGNKAHPNIKDKILSIRPIAVKDSPASPISWVCGYSAVPEGMIAGGENRTSIERKSLPVGCR